MPSLDEQAAFLRGLEERSAVEVVAGPEKNDDDWEFEGIISVDEVAGSGLRGKLREVQRICEEGGEVVPATVVDVVNLARKVVETKRENVAFVEDRTKALAKVEELQGTVCSLQKELDTTNTRVNALETRLAQSTESVSRIQSEELQVKAGFCARFRELEGSLQSERTMLERATSDHARKVDKLHQSLSMEQDAHAASCLQLTISGAAWVKEREDIVTEVVGAKAQITLQTSGLVTGAGETVEGLRAVRGVLEGKVIDLERQSERMSHEGQMLTEELERCRGNAKEATDALAAAKTDILEQNGLREELSCTLDTHMERLKELETALRAKECELSQ